MSIAATPLPPLFVEKIACFPGLAEALDTEPSIAIRHNPRKSAAPPVCAVPWCPWGEWLDSRPDFTFDPAMHQGAYYVQDASSMAAYAAVADAAEMIGHRPLRLLDMCAAPGGKSTAATDALPDGSLIVSNEFDFRRADVLAENIAKWGYPNVAVTRGDTGKLAKLEGAFDIIVVDAPCSGEGMMRKDYHAREQWSASLVHQCAILQREILADAWRALAPGGIIIYSTCTFNRDENEANVEWLIQNYGARSVALPSLDCHRDVLLPAVDGKASCYRFLPGMVRGEGLFIAALAKDNGTEFRIQKSKSLYAKAPAYVEEAAKRMLSTPDYFDIMMRDSMAYAVPRAHSAFLLAVSSLADTLAAGVPMAQVKGHDLVPTQQLALSQCLNAQGFPRVEVDTPVAVAYLQRQSASVDAPKGIVLLTHGGLPLGFVKNLGNRANNLYPKNWRILSTRPNFSIFC